MLLAPWGLQIQRCGLAGWGREREMGTITVIKEGRGETREKDRDWELRDGEKSKKDQGAGRRKKDEKKTKEEEQEEEKGRG